MTLLNYEPKSIEFEIDGIRYTKRELLVTERNILLFKIAQLAGAAGEGLGSLGDNIDFGKMIMGILYKYKPEEAAAFIKETIIAGLEFPNFKNLMEANRFAYEYHFTQYYEHQIPVLIEIWNQNFGKQIEELKKKLSSSKMISRMFSVIIGEIQEVNTQKESQNSMEENQ